MNDPLSEPESIPLLLDPVTDEIPLHGPSSDVQTKRVPQKCGGRVTFDGGDTLSERRTDFIDSKEPVGTSASKA